MIIIFLMGMALLLWGATPAIKRIPADKFEETEVSSLEARISEASEYAATTMNFYTVSARYSYDFNGETYESDCIEFSGKPKFSDASLANDFLCELQKVTQCKVSKRNPKVAYLVGRPPRGSRTGREAFIVVGVAMILFSMASML